MSTPNRRKAGMGRARRAHVPIIQEDITEQMVTLGLQIPASDHRALKKLAAEQGETMSTYIRQAIRHIVENDGRL